ncbi:hypothetical protein BLHB2_02490 [Bacillus licheniformis]|nr:hypothetical protein BLHB2_02490 [Bacillus licheniformis]
MIDPRISLIMLEDDKLIAEKRWFSRVPQCPPALVWSERKHIAKYRYDTVG